MNRFKHFVFTILLLFISLLWMSCDKDEISADATISSITEDINLYDDKTYLIDTDIDHITGSINIGEIRFL